MMTAKIRIANMRCPATGNPAGAGNKRTTDRAESASRRPQLLLIQGCVILAAAFAPADWSATMLMKRLHGVSIHRYDRLRVAHRLCGRSNGRLTACCHVCARGGHRRCGGGCTCQLLNSHIDGPYQNAFVIEYLLQIKIIKLPQEDHLIAAISPHNSGIVSLHHLATAPYQ